MGREYEARVFKSGNSVAVRLPKALGYEPGQRMLLKKDGDGLKLELVTKRRGIDLDGLWGVCPGLEPLADETRVFDRSPRAWDDHVTPGRQDPNHQ